MPHTAKHILTTILATLALTIAIGSASANRLSLSSQTIRATWTSLRFTNTVNSTTILCPLTLEGSFHSATIVKTRGALIGYITRATVRNPCTGGTTSIKTASLPWHVRYVGYSGELPRITLLTLQLIRLEIEIREAGGNTCAARTEVEHPAEGRIAVIEETGGNRLANSLTPDSTRNIPLTTVAGGIFCGLASGRFSEVSQTLTQLGSTARILLRLI
jgi:hypothetical protein